MLSTARRSDLQNTPPLPASLLLTPSQPTLCSLVLDERIFRKHHRCLLLLFLRRRYLLFFLRRGASDNRTCKEVIRSFKNKKIMESSSRSGKTHVKPYIDLRFSPTPSCSCEKMADIRVVFSLIKKSKGMMYYYCSNNQCGFFYWCKPDYATWFHSLGLAEEDAQSEGSRYRPQSTPNSDENKDKDTKFGDENCVQVEKISGGSHVGDGYVHIGWVACLLLLVLLIIVCVK